MSKILELPKPKPDVDDLRRFIECVFRGATAADGFVGLRRFQNGDDGKSRTPWAPLNGDLVPTALAVADEAASAGWGDDGWSFAPPVCLFGAKIKENGYRSAEQANVSFCSVIVIDADERPEEVRADMTRILGEPTMIVASGGTWEGQEKLHLYWRLTEPARDPDTLERLRKARKRAVAIARTDPSIAPLNHPIRWPGSLHTKREPRRCRIVSFTDKDIDLTYAEFALSMAGGGSLDEPDGNVFTAGDGRRVSFSTRVAWSRKQLDEAARIIPNEDRSWDDWNKIAMAFYDASHASSDGLEAMIAWSSKSDKFENDVCESRWSHFHESPPSRLSAGTLRHLMGEVDERYKSKPGASAEDWFEALDEAAIEFTPLGDDWRAALLAERSGKQISVISCVTNAIVPLRHAGEWRGVLRQNKLLGETWMCQPAPWMKASERAVFKPRAWVDTDDIRATEWVQRAGVPVGEKLVSQAVETVAEENGFDPVIDYLDGLVWDGTPRIETWLIDYMEADDTVFVRAVASRFLISAVARAYRPGCKSDTMLILEGEQGKRKSSAIDVLGGPFYSDDSGEIGTKDGALLASGAWIVEMGELDALSKVEATRIKAFLSRRIDRYRPPFGRRPVSRPRPSVYVGTTNGDTYLKDETGGRRFWPVYVHGADIARLTLDRDQLWAEAVVAFKAGRPWWLETNELTTLAEAEQGSRYEEDAWTDRISAWLQQENVTDVSPVEVMSGCLHIPVPQQNRVCAMRVNRVLRSLGWEKYRSGRGSPRRYKRSVPA